MVAVPSETPVNKPAPVMDAIAGAVVLHAPPETVLDNREEIPAQTPVVPAMGPGCVVTVIVVAVPHPAAGVKLMMVVPAATPETRPETGSTLAVDTSAEAHVPLPPPSASCRAEPAQKGAAPVIGGAVGLTVTA